MNHQLINEYQLFRQQSLSIMTSVKASKYFVISTTFALTVGQRRLDTLLASQLGRKQGEYIII